jgi:ABC-type multidrug transport system permease subunit
MLLAGLATGNKIGLVVVGLLFVSFALVCSFVIPRRKPDFPGEKGIGVFAIVCVVLFAAQLTSILVFDKEKKEVKPAKAMPVHVQALKLQSHAQRASK